MLLRDSQGKQCEAMPSWNEDGSTYLTSAVYINNGEPVEEEELDWMERHHPDILDCSQYDRWIIQAEAMYESQER